MSTLLWNRRAHFMGLPFTNKRIGLCNMAKKEIKSYLNFLRKWSWRRLEFTLSLLRLHRWFWRRQRQGFKVIQAAWITEMDWSLYKSNFCRVCAVQRTNQLLQCYHYTHRDSDNWRISPPSKDPNFEALPLRGAWNGICHGLWNYLHGIPSVLSLQTGKVLNNVPTSFEFFNIPNVSVGKWVGHHPFLVASEGCFCIFTWVIAIYFDKRLALQTMVMWPFPFRLIPWPNVLVLFLHW